MKSSTLLLLVAVVLCSRLALGEACLRDLARARISFLLNVFPDLADEIRNGRLGPNRNNNQQYQNQNPNGLPNNNNNNQLLPNGQQQMPNNQGLNGMNGNSQGQFPNQQQQQQPQLQQQQQQQLPQNGQQANVPVNQG